MKQKVAVVTGVSKGIGEAICKLLLEANYHVYGLGRTPFPHIHSNFQFIECKLEDVNEVEASFRKIIHLSQNSIDILINNAGMGYFGGVEELPTEQWNEMFSINVNAMFYCCRQVVPLMKQNGSGHIINIASTAALEGMALSSGYCATKWAVKGFSESIWKELRDYKIKVTCVYPGSVKTDFFRNSKAIKPHDYMLMPDDVAGMILYAIQTPSNFHTVNLEIRPLQPKGPVQK